RQQVRISDFAARGVERRARRASHGSACRTAPPLAHNLRKWLCRSTVVAGNTPDDVTTSTPLARHRRSERATETLSDEARQSDRRCGVASPSSYASANRARNRPGNAGLLRIWRLR